MTWLTFLKEKDTHYLLVPKLVMFVFGLHYSAISFPARYFEETQHLDMKKFGLLAASISFVYSVGGYLDRKSVV